MSGRMPHEWSLYLSTALSITLLSLLLGCSAKPREFIHRTLTYDGVDREYFVHLPNGNNRANQAVVIELHGYTSTATGFAAYHGTNRHADAHGYIAVYPQGTHFKDPTSRDTSEITSWNDLAANLGPRDAGPHCAIDSDPYPCPPDCGTCNRCAWTSCADDVGFIEKVLDQVEEEFKTDRRRAYLLGVSNGGMMTWRMGCNLSHRFAAIAPIIGQLAPGYACAPESDTPAIHLFGGMDSTVRFDGTAGSDGFRYTSAADAARVWTKSMNCKSGPVPWKNEHSELAKLQCTAYRDCEVTDHEVISCIDPVGGHDWPSQRIQSIASATCVSDAQIKSMPGQTRCEAASDDYTSHGMDLIWSFFSRYALDDH